MPVKCPACKYSNKDGALVCNLCGERLGGDKKVVDLGLAGVAGGGAAAEAAAAIAKSQAGAGSPGGEELWISCPPFDPLKLPRDRKFTIGRAPGNDLVLPVAMVSRNHATIVWNKDHFVLTDLDSANGCYVNGEKVQQRRLQVGDKLKIDPYGMEIRGPAAASTPVLDAAEATLNISRSELLGARAGITGKLRDMPLSDVVQMLGQQRKTGALKIRSGPGRGDDRGVIYFVEGEVVDARANEKTGEEGFYQLMELDDGTFQFVGEGARQDRTIARKTHNLLLEAMRVRDEKRKGT
ncbi:MAG: DUF4388 domain-containing protein [Planctomycetales bacterium]|nr:DUF4388 domain-containing protein [Planctomycetales bacterium]